ncbi:MAG TPA: family 20 glycosylhydrolase [Gammaproteobacteria bacterium]|jgi:hexosaminidase
MKLHGLCLLACLLAPAAFAGPAQQYGLIPQPAQIRVRHGNYGLQDTATVTARGDAAVDAARYFTELTARTRGLHLQLRTTDIALPAAVVFTQEPGLAPSLGKEGYRLDIGPGGARISAADAAGLFYGGVTLWELLTPNTAQSKTATLPLLSITDRPRFPWRGLMLDSARHFQSLAEIEQLIDWMALHKLNVLQWHLTDDQGWRLQIEKYPQLTAVGGCRAAVGPDAALTGSPDKLYCGSYTQAQAREIVAYAAARHVTVVPEIEMPGHAQAAIAAYPEFGVTGAHPAVSTDWGVHSYLYNPDTKTLRFLEDVLDEVMAIFPSTFIDVGGDEALKDQWHASAAVQTQMHTLGIKDEDALQAWMIQQMQAYLQSHGRRLIGWDEILSGGLPNQAAVMSWHGGDAAIQAATQGHDVVLAYAPTLYLDNLQSAAHDEPAGRPSVISLQDVYDFDPMPAAIPAADTGHVLGAQLNLWTEYMPTFARDQHAIFPRLAALAEITWSPASGRDWDGFLARLPAELARYRALGIDYADSAFAPSFTLTPTTGGNIQVTLQDQSGSGELRYTLDGSAPTLHSSLYTRPLSLKPPQQVQAAAFTADGRGLSAPRQQMVDQTALLTRNSDALDTCSGKLVLRIEDDRPLQGPRPVYRVDIMDMCWHWPAAPLDGMRRLQVTIGNLPWNYQLGHDATGVVIHPSNGAPSLEVHLDSCDGRKLADLSLTQAATTLLQSQLSAALPPLQGKHDLCFIVTGDPAKGLWAIDKVELQP